MKPLCNGNRCISCKHCLPGVACLLSEHVPQWPHMPAHMWRKGGLWGHGGGHTPTTDT